MLGYKGFLNLSEIKNASGFPGSEILAKRKCVVIECVQAIPCNPCEAACPRGAIKIGDSITNLPVVNPEKCIGCGICIAKCPGLAIFMVDQSASDFDMVSMPYEYYPLPEVDDEVYCLNRSGIFKTKGIVENVLITKANDKTAVVEVKVPKGYGMEIRNFSISSEGLGDTSGCYNFPKEKHINEDLNNNILVCRCEEVTKAEVIKAIHNGATSVDEVKRATRTGMGLCQGRNCSRTIERIIAQELHQTTSTVKPSSKRPPVRPVKSSVYTSLIELKKK